tara:strand:- start:7083 stop:8006 length:924 start_codon:yes stop_codon:yes gene_type:complete
MARIIITGTNGFIGKALAKELHKSNEILALTTNIKKCLFNSITYEEFLNGNSKKLNEFSPTHFIHCAAIAHKISPFRKKKKSFINEINKFLPSKLAIKCKELKIKRFIFISSIGVFGNQKIINKNSKYKPNNFYSLTKSEAEKLLKKILNKSNCELTIIRPTVVYGFECPGNFQILRLAIDLNLPIPFASSSNKRSIIYLGNLVSAISHATFHPNAANKSFNIADSELITTQEIIKLIAFARGKKYKFLNLPIFLNHIIRSLPFVSKIFAKLSGDLIVDSTLFNSKINWNQPFKQKQSLIDSFSKKN